MLNFKENVNFVAKANLNDLDLIQEEQLRELKKFT